MLKYEGVTFLMAPAKALTKEEFIAKYLNVFWQDKSEEIRRKMLGNVYNLIKGTGKSKK